MSSITYEQANKLDELEKKLVAKFKRAQKVSRELAEEKQMLFSPITTAIEKLQTNIENASSELVPLHKQEAQEEEEIEPDVDEDRNAFIPAIESTPFRHQVDTPERGTPDVEESHMFGSPVPRSLPTDVILGKNAQKFLPRAKDEKFGIWYDAAQKSYMIGNKRVTFDYDDLIVGDIKYVGTPGLWRLLTYAETPHDSMFTDNDYQNYRHILLYTDSMFRGNDRSSKKPKNSRGNKWNTLVKDIWMNKEGSGLLEFNDKNIEYKYVDNLKELLARLNYIYAQEQAGNNNFHNEKIGLLHFVLGRLESLIDTPKGVEYLIRYVSALPPKILKDEHIGSGLFNSLLKKIPFEMHAPGYNFLGPGTKLDERLERGDKGINKLDEAAKEHDIFYRDHSKTKERHVADKILEDKAWERFKSGDADMNEKFWSAATAVGMNVKRKLGMGITPKLKF